MPNLLNEEYEDVLPWVREALSDERWFGDGPPHWLDASTADQAQREQDRFIRFLRKHGPARPYYVLDDDTSARPSTRIETCEPRERCLAASCPVCTRAFQRYLVAEWDRLLKNDFAAGTDASMLTLIWEIHRDLDGLSLEAMQREVKVRLRDAGIEFAFGGIDMSFNQVGYADRGDWCFHLHLVVLSSNPSVWSKKLRSIRARYDEVERAIMIKPFDGNLHGLAYLWKPDIKRRVKYLQEKRRKGKKRYCFNTSEQSLRVKERIQLQDFLNPQGLASRVFLLGARPTRTDEGISIVKIVRKSANSELAEKPQLALQKPG
jgi:hypothetical protein